jgi:Type I phosphodiesterase / nucleotide pyrophosphatase
MDTLSTEGTTEVRPIVTRNSLAFSDSYTLNGKVLVIALDGATLDLIEPMMAEGILPNLAKIASQGADGKLCSTILPLSPTVWTSSIPANGDPKEEAWISP